tara:strand:+ start:494 stop:685 length:192 start_codon:yes stop_codon:yes gene_type:complete
MCRYHFVYRVRSYLNNHQKLIVDTHSGAGISNVEKYPKSEIREREKEGEKITYLRKRMIKKTI